MRIMSSDVGSMSKVQQGAPSPCHSSIQLRREWVSGSTGRGGVVGHERNPALAPGEIGLGQNDQLDSRNCTGRRVQACCESELVFRPGCRRQVCSFVRCAQPSRARIPRSKPDDAAQWKLVFATERGYDDRNCAEEALPEFCRPAFRTLAGGDGMMVENPSDHMHLPASPPPNTTHPSCPAQCCPTHQGPRRWGGLSGMQWRRVCHNHQAPALLVRCGMRGAGTSSTGGTRSRRLRCQGTPMPP